MQEIVRQCAEREILVDTTSSFAYLSEDSLAHYRAIILNGVPPEELNYRQQNELERFAQAGGEARGPMNAPAVTLFGSGAVLQVACPSRKSRLLRIRL